MRRRVSPGYIHDNKANLLFRYELSVSGLKRFDEEFQHYLQDVGLQIDVGRASKELPGENLLPTLDARRHRPNGVVRSRRRGVPGQGGGAGATPR